MDNRTVLSIIVVVLICGANACSTPADQVTSTPEPRPTATAIVPSDTATPRPPRSGKEVYDEECLSCHRLDDVDTMGPGLAGLFELEFLPNGSPLNDQSLADLIARGTEGAGAMPGIQLKEHEMDAVITYMKDVLQ